MIPFRPYAQKQARKAELEMERMQSRMQTPPVLGSSLTRGEAPDSVTTMPVSGKPRVLCPEDEGSPSSLRADSSEHGSGAGPRTLNTGHTLPDRPLLDGESLSTGQRTPDNGHHRSRVRVSRVRSTVSESQVRTSDTGHRTCPPKVFQWQQTLLHMLVEQN